MGARSNAKGAEFEIEICRVLTEWVTGKRRPEIFWRSATSGAKATVDIQAGRQSHMGGDIVAIHPHGQWVTDMFSIECKNRKSFGTLPHFLLDTTPLMEWWEQCCNDAKQHNKNPWLIFKEKNSKIYTAFHAQSPNLRRPPNGLTIYTDSREPFHIAELAPALARNTLLVSSWARPQRTRPQRVTQ